MTALPDYLVGRSETVELWPLSQGEIEGVEEHFVDAVYNSTHEAGYWPDSSLHKEDYFRRALRGGYPEAVKRQDIGRRERFFQAYINDLITRDIKSISDINETEQMKRLMGLLAGGAANLIVNERYSQDLNITAKTVKRYIELLQLIFLIHCIPAWSNNATTRAVSASKLLFTDSGVLAHLLNLKPARLAHPNAPIGPLMENFVLGEIARQLTWSSEMASLYHYRDRDGNEVDGIIENAAGEFVGIEVKSAESVNGGDFKGLRHFAQKVAGRFIGGYVLYTGTQALPFGERMWALPISTLWSELPCPTP
jgi:predicted AAA+ superfamily ATPase